MINIQKSKQIIFTSNPDAGNIALNEIRAVDSDVILKEWLSPGVGWVESGCNWKAFVKSLQRRPPIFCRHICPVQIDMPVKQDMTDIDHLEKAACRLIPILDLKRSFSVQTRLLGNGWPFARYDINDRLSNALKKQGALLDVRKPVQVLSVVLTPAHGYMGLSNAENNLSDWAGGARRLKREKGQISRAEFKLTEALELFEMSLPNTGKALDLGAAPGGWTRILLKQSMHVTAVDPADLDPRIKSDPDVKYIRRTADSYLSTSKELFDVILNDMRIDARESAHLMMTAETNLKAEGFALLTLKLPIKKMMSTADSALKLLRRRYIVIDARQLFHNRHEITVALRKIIN